MKRNLLIRIIGILFFILYLILVKYDKKNLLFQYVAISITFICFIFLSYVALMKIAYYFKLLIISISDVSNKDKY